MPKDSMDASTFDSDMGISRVRGSEGNKTDREALTVSIAWECSRRGLAILLVVLRSPLKNLVLIVRREYTNVGVRLCPSRYVRFVVCIEKSNIDRVPDCTESFVM